MAIKIAVFNQKGGVGKTTSTMNISAIVAQKGKKVLIIDNDQQCNCSKHLLMEHEKAEHTISDILQKKAGVSEAVIHVGIRSRGNAKPRYRNVDLLAGSDTLLADMSELEPDRLHAIVKDQIDEQYDYVFYDCPTQASDISAGTLIAADYVLVPASPDDDSLDGYGQLLETITEIKRQGLNNRLQVAGVFFTNVDTRTSFEKYIVNDFSEMLGADYLGFTRHMAVCKEATFSGRPLIYYAAKAAVTEDYVKITDRLLEKVEG